MNPLKVLVLALISTGFSQISYAEVSSCRGVSKEYGQFAFSLKTGFSGRMILRSCKGVSEIATHFDSSSKNYDTYVMSGFGIVRCEKLTDEPLTVKCILNNKLLADDLRDDIGTEFRKVLSFGYLNFEQMGGNRAKLTYQIEVPGYPVLQKSVDIENIICTKTDVKEDEARCVSGF
jgi:hypothetical protein